MNYKSNCLFCNRTFQHSKPDKDNPHKFCSRQCFHNHLKANATYSIKNCKNCGKEFLNRLHPKVVFCSSKCRAEYYSKQKTKEIKKLKPTLEKLYYKEKLSASKIAKKLNINKRTIFRWFKKLNIQSKTSVEGRHYNHLPMPSKEVLYNQTLVQEKTYRELAKMYKCSIHRISNYLTLYNIPKPSSKEPTKRQLEKLYLDEHLTAFEIGKIIKLSKASVLKRLRKFNIPVRPGGFNPRGYQCEDGHIVKSTYERRVDNWLYQHKLSHQYEPHLPWNNYQRSDFKVNDYYIEIWGMYYPEYKERKLAKRKQYKKYDLKLIQIYPVDFAKKRGIDRKLNKLLSKNNKKNYEQLTFTT